MAGRRVADRGQLASCSSLLCAVHWAGGQANRVCHSEVAWSCTKALAHAQDGQPCCQSRFDRLVWPAHIPRRSGFHPGNSDPQCWPWRHGCCQPKSDRTNKVLARRPLGKAKLLFVQAAKCCLSTGPSEMNQAGSGRCKTQPYQTFLPAGHWAT